MHPPIQCLNLGCGSRYHPEWVNVDFVASSPCVQAHDLNKGIPYPPGTFDVVYHSHVLEHFSKERAPVLLAECYRVMKKGGVLRVAVPDLERIARGYLEALENVTAGQTESERRYEWMMLELYDQTVREKPGGSMLDYLRSASADDDAFVFRRMGGEATRIIKALRKQPDPAPADLSTSAGLPARIRRIPEVIRVKALRALLGEDEYAALQVARFRASGEIHRWMYDRHSLSKLLQRAGFQGAEMVGATESRIPDWAAYNLDTEPDGAVYKPDSLYMEARKP